MSRPFSWSRTGAGPTDTFDRVVQPAYQAHDRVRILFLKNGDMRLKILALLTLATPGLAQEKVAFFGLHMLDKSLQTTELGQDPAEVERLAMLEALVAERFTEEGYRLVDIEPARDKIDRVANMAKCYGCDTRIAAELGADYSLVGEVQKTSNLIMAINLQLRSAETGEMVKGGVADIRGNTDDTWRRGMRYILKNRFFAEQAE